MLTKVQKKVCLLGEFAVGKTSLVRRFVTGRFDEKYLSTIGVNISRKQLTRKTYELNLMLWDLAGGEDFVHMGASYLKGAAGALIVCDLTRADTLPSIQKYTNQLRVVSPQSQIIVVGNKIDLEDQRLIRDDMIEAVSAEIDAPFFLTSAKSGVNVEAAFSCLADMMEGVSDNVIAR